MLNDKIGAVSDRGIGNIETENRFKIIVPRIVRYGLLLLEVGRGQAARKPYGQGQYYPCKACDMCVAVLQLAVKIIKACHEPQYPVTIAEQPMPQGCALSTFAPQTCLFAQQLLGSTTLKRQISVQRSGISNPEVLVDLLWRNTQGSNILETD